MGLNGVRADLDGDHAKYAALLGNLSESNCAYSNALEIHGVLSRAFVAAGLAAWEGMTYTQDVTEVALAVLAHPDNRQALLQFLAETEERYPTE